MKFLLYWTILILFVCRYNISTSDYDSWTTNSSANGNGGSQVNIGSNIGLTMDEAKKRGYVLKNNPVVQPFESSNKFELQLAINTAQYGRTFQDRCHYCFSVLQFFLLVLEDFASFF